MRPNAMTITDEDRRSSEENDQVLEIEDAQTVPIVERAQKKRS